MDLSELFSVKGKTVLITGGGQVRPARLLQHSAPSLSAPSGGLSRAAGRASAR